MHIRYNRRDWPSWVDLVLTTDPEGQWYLVPRSTYGDDWIKDKLCYEGAKTFTGSVPLDPKEVSHVYHKANGDGVSIVIK